MFTLAHIFPLESERCRTRDSDPLKFHAHVKKNIDMCVLQCQNNFILQNLLFQCAASHAFKESTVIYIRRQRPEIEPLGVHGLPPPNRQVLNSVKFLGLDTVEDVVDFCASIHSKVDKMGRPTLIILDDIGSYIEQIQAPCQEQKVAKLCALLCDAVHFINTKRGGSCCLLLSCPKPSHSVTSVFKTTEIQIIDIHENTPGEFALTTFQENRTFEVEFCLLRGTLFFKKFCVTFDKKKKTGNVAEGETSLPKADEGKTANVAEGETSLPKADEGKTANVAEGEISKPKADEGKTANVAEGETLPLEADKGI